MKFFSKDEINLHINHIIRKNKSTKDDIIEESNIDGNSPLEGDRKNQNEKNDVKGNIKNSNSRNNISIEEFDNSSVRENKQKALVNKSDLKPNFEVESSNHSREFLFVNSVIENNIIYIDGGIVNPGPYPVSSSIDIESLISYAGGYTNNAKVDDFNNQGSKNVLTGSSVFIPIDYEFKKSLKISGEIKKSKSD